MKKQPTNTTKADNTKRKRGHPSNPVIDELVKAGGYTRRGARKIAAEAKATGESVVDLASARLRKVKLEGDKLEYSLEVFRGKHIPRAKVEEVGLTLGTIVSAQLAAFSRELPGRLEGLTAAQMEPIVSSETDKVKQTLVKELEKHLSCS
jgi:hypothetical protein